jgi:hypothetical protein
MFTILEKGDIYFFYRPKINKSIVNKKADVGKFFFIIHDRSDQFYRIIIIGKKQLPTANLHPVEFAFVSKVATDQQQLLEFLEEQRYMTKTRGERTVPAAHPIGEGKYLFLKMGKITHFVYLIEKSERGKSIQKEFKLANEGIFIVQVKNPEHPSDKGLAPDQRADYPASLEKKFKKKKFSPLESGAFLNYEGSELLLIGERSKPSAPWRKGLKTILSSFNHHTLGERLPSRAPAL